MMVLLYALFNFLPQLDPKKDNYKKFSRAYRAVQFFVLLFLGIIWLISIAANLGYAVPIGKIIGGIVGLLFIILGYYLPTLKTNWFIGIRTPWTISDDKVWERTHILGKKVFMMSGVLIIISPHLPVAIGSTFFLIAVLLFLWPVVYSYVIYKKK
jgi:uncharacterized membrane protein